MKEGLSLQQSDRSKVEQWQQMSLAELSLEASQTRDSDKYSLVQNILHKDLKSDSSHDELSQVKGAIPRRKVLKKKKQKSSGKSSPRVQESIFELEVSGSSEDEPELQLSKSSSMPLVELPLLPDDRGKLGGMRRTATFDSFLHPVSEPETELTPADRWVNEIKVYTCQVS